MDFNLFQVDAFTDSPFSGNPAAVALVDSFTSSERLQEIAAEMNLSETAFPMRRADGSWDLRWFTPTTEVDLCGHATLATAHVLFERAMVNDDPVVFHTRSGQLTCRPSDAGYTMEFPASPPTSIEPVHGLAEALGVTVAECAQDFDVLALLESPQTVLNLQPDLDALAKIETRAVIVTAEGDIDGGRADFVSRVFCPRFGVPEDPVTGSSHCILGPWRGHRLSKSDLHAHQVSPRGGRMTVRLHGPTVLLEGQAITVFEAYLKV